MLTTLHSVVPLTRAAYSSDGDPDPIRWRSGQLVEYMDVLDRESGITLRVTVAELLNGYEPGGGEVVDLVCEHTIEDKIVFSQNGKPYSTAKHKLRAVAVAKASAPASA